MVADMYEEKEDFKSATPLVREAADVSEALLARDPSNPAAQHDVVRTREDVAEVCEQQGDLNGALDAVMKLRMLATTRLEQDPADATLPRQTANYGR